MTPNPFVINPTAIVGDISNIDGLFEANVIMALANKFTPLFSGILADEGLIEPPLPTETANVADTGMKTIKNKNKRPFTLEGSAADIVDATNGHTSTSSPPTLETETEPEPEVEERPAKKTRCCSKSPSRTRCSSNSSQLPTARDPMDKSFSKKLYTKRDVGRINSAHIIIRRDVLEVRRTLSGKVFFQCGCCKHLPRTERVKLSTLAPQCIDNIYRSMIRFMMHHVSKCEHIPKKIKGLSPKSTRVVNERGTKAYWVKSAKKLGLRDCVKEKNIVSFPKPVKK